MTINVEFYRNTAPKKQMNHLGQVALVEQDAIYLRKQAPGEFGNVIDRPATDQDKKEHARQWGQFQRGEEQVVDGTPIDALAPLYHAVGPKIVAGLRGYGVHTLEQLAGLSAHAIAALGGGMGGQTWVNDARKLLAEGSRGVSARDYTRDFAALEARIAALEAWVARVEDE